MQYVSEVCAALYIGFAPSAAICSVTGGFALVQIELLYIYQI